jgi:hypothetical protein
LELSYLFGDKEHWTNDSIISRENCRAAIENWWQMAGTVEVDENVLKPLQGMLFVEVLESRSQEAR